MITVWLGGALHQNRNRISAPHLYQIADQQIALDVLLDELAPFVIKTLQSFPPPPEYSPNRLALSQTAQVVSGWIGDQEREIHIRAELDHYRLNVEGGGEFVIASDGSTIVHVSSDDASINRSAIVGGFISAALYLALALQGVFCLHASALWIEDQAVAIIGPSGAGKSTLGRWLRKAEPDWQRIADDILPIRHSISGITALPHFPQSRLGLNQAPSLNLAHSLPLGAIYVLNVPTELAVPHINEMEPRAAIRSLLFETVGASLFSSHLLIQQLGFATQVYRSIPIKSLVYPHWPEVLPAVHRLIIDDLA